MSGLFASEGKLTEELKTIKESIASWRPQTDVWALVNGAKISSLCVAGSSFTILMRVRLFYNLFSQQHLLGTILPIVVLPSVGYVISHELFMERKLLGGFSSGKLSDSFCTTCFETRGAVLQTTFGVLAPFCLSILSCSAAAISYRTYPVPHLNHLRKVFNMSRRAGGGFSSTLVLLTLGNVVAGGYVAQKMLDQYIFLQSVKNEEIVDEPEENK